MLVMLLKCVEVLLCNTLAERYNNRHGSNECDCSSSAERSSPVMLSAAKHLCIHQERPFPFATLRASAYCAQGDMV